MNGQTDSSIHSLFGKWQDEDHELEQYIDDVRDWMNDVVQFGIPRFGEAATRLRQLRGRLTTHFDHEDEIGVQLEGLYSADSVELRATRRQAERDHQQLLVNLDDLIKRLNEPDPPFASWESAIEEVELFVVALERHEDQEAESVKMLIPQESDDSKSG